MDIDKYVRVYIEREDIVDNGGEAFAIGEQDAAYEGSHRNYHCLFSFSDGDLLRILTLHNKIVGRREQVINLWLARRRDERWSCHD